MIQERIETQLNTLPSSPGVYLFKDAQDTVIYVGKAVSLTNRVRSYFSPPSANTDPTNSLKQQRLIPQIHDIDFIITDTEQEALILENTLIKKYHPRYNVRLKDGKTYPYLKIDMQNDWPSIRVTRSYTKDGSRYFGPFASASLLRKTIKTIKRIFPFRSCHKTLTGKSSPPCLQYHMHRCLGPCAGNVSMEEYADVIKQVILFLEGKQEIVLKELKQKMKAASQSLHYEKAALYRDQIEAVENIIEGQKNATIVKGEQDVIAFVQNNDIAYFEIFFIRNNKITGRDFIVLDGVRDEEQGKVMTAFVKLYYSSAPAIPPNILLQYPLDEPDIIVEWLSKLREASVSLSVPHRGAKKQLMDMVAENARQGFELYQLKKSMSLETMDTLTNLRELLSLKDMPARIEGYDISTIQGAYSVGSMVVFQKGVPRPQEYRRFKIKTVLGLDDFSMLQEVVRRRFEKYLAQDKKWNTPPELILIDGGKGQLHAVCKVLNDLNVNTIPIIGLAKEREEVFVPDKSAPLNIPQTSKALHLLERVRDEAHRFAIGYHRSLRHKGATTSKLDEVPGIGPKRKKALLKALGSVSNIRVAAIEDIAKVEGMNEKLARTIKESL